MAKSTGAVIRGTVGEPGSTATHPGCDVPIERVESVLAESVKIAGEWIAPGIDAAPWAASERPISYDYTFHPCGHTVRHYVGSGETLLTMVNDA